MAEARAHIKYIRISAIKLRTIADWVKGMKPNIALDYLSVNQNRTAKVLYKAIKSAVDNGVTNHGMDRQAMKFKALKIDQGPGLKRFRAGSRGTAKPYVRPLSHITIVLETDRIKPKAVKKAKQLPEGSTEKSTDKLVEAQIKAEEPKKVVKATKAPSKVRSTQKKA